MRPAAKTFLAFAYLLAFALPGAAHSYSDEEQAFFSYERFYLNSAALLSLSKQAELKNDIRAFMRNFSEGIYAVSGGDFRKQV